MTQNIAIGNALLHRAVSSFLIWFSSLKTLREVGKHHDVGSKLVYVFYLHIREDLQTNKLEIDFVFSDSSHGAFQGRRMTPKCY